MQDKETGSEGSWHSLMDDAQRRWLFRSRRGMRLALNPPKDDAWLTAISFYGAIKEQAEGLVKTNTIDAFLPCGAGVSDRL